MTYLLLQTFLLLLSAYFLGAFLACLVKRPVMRSRALAAAAPRATVTARPLAATPLARPRSIDPVQPKIDILPRPEPRAAPAQASLDTSRFDRALTGPDPNAGMPRKAIVEIRPSILKSPTGPAQPLKPKPTPALVPAPVQAAPAKPAEPIKPVVATPIAKPVEAAVPAKPVTPAPQPSAPQPSAPQTTAAPSMSSGTAAASAAAAAAVAAAKSAAASASVAAPRPVAPAPAPTIPAAQVTPARATPVQAPPAQTAPAPPPAPVPAAPVAVAKPAATAPSVAATQAPTAPVAVTTPPVAAQPAHLTGGDDLQRIRAIDADTERRLQGLGVRRFDDIARWTAADINRVNQALGLTGRIDREQWIEQSQILAKGGETYYSRNRGAAMSAAAPAQAPSAPKQTAPAATTPSSAAQTLAPATSTSAAASVKPAAPAPATTQPLQAAPSITAPSAMTASSLPQGRSVAEMATAAAAAIAAASASVTRGIRPIEPISPMTRANPNISMPARLSDAIKSKDAKPAAEHPAKDQADARPPRSEPTRTAGAGEKSDDLKRIRGVGVLIEKRLNALGVTSYNDVAHWTSGDIDRISQTLDFKGRIERENWVEQARILSSGGQTEFSRRVDRGDVESSRDPEGA